MKNVIHLKPSYLSKYWSLGTTNAVHDQKSENIFISVLTVLRRIPDTCEMLINYVVTEREFRIETLFPKVCVIHPGCRARISLPSYYHHPYDLHHHDLFTNSRSVPSLQLYCHHLHMELYYLLYKVLQCTPYRAPTKILHLLPLSPQRSVKAQT